MCLVHLLSVRNVITEIVIIYVVVKNYQEHV